MQISKMVQEHSDVIKHMYYQQKQSGNYEKGIKDIYSFAKNIAPEYYQNGRMLRDYYEVVKTIVQCEQIFPEKYIIDSNPKFDITASSKITTRSEPIDILNYLVNETRKYLVFKHSWDIEKPIDIKELNFANECEDASEIVKGLCDLLNIESYVIVIHPGYNEYANLYNGCGFHYCNIIKLGTKYYLVDCTYCQFFLMTYNFLERLGVVGLSGCDLGIFMTITDSRKKLATKILEDGWIELTESTIKDYFDGFTISYRNGLYYEDTLDFSYTTMYDAADYRRFILGESHQLQYEKRKHLGYQRQLLKNPNLSFQKR